MQFCAREKNEAKNYIMMMRLVYSVNRAREEILRDFNMLTRFVKVRYIASRLTRGNTCSCNSTHLTKSYAYAGRIFSSSPSSSFSSFQFSPSAIASSTATGENNWRQTKVHSSEERESEREKKKREKEKGYKCRRPKWEFQIH